MKIYGKSWIGEGVDSRGPSKIKDGAARGESTGWNTAMVCRRIFGDVLNP